MRRYLKAQVTAKRFDEVGAWVAGVLLLAVCTALGLLMASELPPRTNFLIGAAVGAGWMVLAVVGHQLRGR
jgi:hypothetical protein